MFIGAITKLVAEGETEQTRETQQALLTTEAHVAEAFIKAADIEYLDRVGMDALASELRLSSSGAFDASTGPSPGLLARLDFLVVIESALPTSVRLRTIDVESGAVKAMGVCEASANWFSAGSFDYSECLSPFVTETLAVARARLASKKLKVEAEAAAIRAREEADARDEGRQVEEEAAAARSREAAEAEAERERQAADKQAAQRRREEQSQRAARQSEIGQIRPEYESAMRRFSTEISFWNQMTEIMAQSGNTFRPEIQQARKAAEERGDECGYYFNSVEPSQLAACLTELNREVDELNSLR